MKTSITIDEGTLLALDRVGRGERGGARSRSRIIEEALKEYLARRARDERDARDLEILNRNAERMNREMEEILAVQADL